MKTFGRLFERATFSMHVFSGAILVSMMFITLADVISRGVFKLTDGSLDLTFIGGVELIKYGLLFTILFALPYSVGRSQVIVDLFTENMKARTKAILEGIYILGFFLLGSGMSYRFFLAIEHAEMSGETTQDLLIPLSYIYAVSSFATAMLALAALLISLRLFFFWNEEKLS